MRTERPREGGAESSSPALQTAFPSLKSPFCFSYFFSWHFGFVIFRAHLFLSEFGILSSRHCCGIAPGSFGLMIKCFEAFEVFLGMRMTIPI